ncbi:MAG: hypothetical protein JWO77_1897 [Ilumatobacteraceae bacterium]|nr:hypothetical protein [Ilumatobacteraceae bacterium]
MQNRLIRRSLFAVSASLSVVAVGCGATGGAPASQHVSSAVAPGAQQAAGIVEAAQATGAITSEKVAITVRTVPADGDPSVSVTSTGEIDGAAGRSHLTADVSGTFGGRSGDATVEAVFDGGSVFLKAPFTSFLADTPWVEVSSPALAEVAERLGGGLQGDPGEFVELLEGAGGPVTTVGTEEVRGVATRHVAVDIDVTKVLDQADPGRRAALEAQLTQRGVSLDDLAPLPAEAWIDDDGFVRRFTISFDLAELAKVHPGAEAEGVVTETIELYDFNEPVDIAVPPASEVTTLDLAKLLDGAGFGHGKQGD